MKNENEEKHIVDFSNIKLPKNFFEKMVMTEFEFSQKHSHEKLLSLIRLYQKAIKYYSYKDKSQVEKYQNRMEYYLTQQDTLKSLKKFNKDKVDNKNILKIFKERFKERAQKIKTEEIRENVKSNLKDIVNLMKYDKMNIRKLMNKDLKNQRKDFLIKLYQKMSIKNSNKSLRSIKKFERSGKSLMKYSISEDVSSDIDFSKLQNENDSTFLKLLSEIDGRETVKGSDDDNDSIIGDSFEEEEYESNYEEEHEKKYKKNYNNKSFIKTKFSVINEIDENEEYEQNYNNNKLIYIKNNMEEIIYNNIQNKYHSSKYLPILKLEPVDDFDKEKNQNFYKKYTCNNINEENDSLNDINIINENIKEVLSKKRKNSDTENIIKNLNLNDEIKKMVLEKSQKIDKILFEPVDAGKNSNPQSTRSLPDISKKKYIEKLPSNLKTTFLEVEGKIKDYVHKLNHHYYTEIFDNFSLKLKKIYDNKYEKYIKVNEEYHSNLIEDQFILENEDKMEEGERIQIQNIIECLKEEQKDQLDQILDEYNNNIQILIKDFKHNLFKNNIGIDLIEEKLKLDIYTMINDSLN